MGNDIRIAIVGCGRIAHQHAAALGNLHITPATLVDIDIGKARLLAGKFHDIPTCTDDITDIMVDDSIDAVIICLPHDLHAEVAIDAISAGKHVLVEKPMCLLRYEADQMIEAADTNNVNLMVGHVLRFAPVHIKVRELIRDGVIGIPVNVTARRLTHRRSLASGWRIEPEVAGSWLLYGLGVHQIDIITWLLDTYTIHVYAQGLIADSRVWKTHDEIAIQGKLATGAITNINLSNNSGKLELDVRIVGTNGDIIIDSKMDIYVNGVMLKHQPGGMFGRQMAEFTCSIADGRLPESSAGSVMNTMETIWAVESSLVYGGIVWLT